MSRKTRYFSMACSFILSLPLSVKSEIFLLEDYPDATSLSVPSTGAVKVPGMNVTLTKDGSISFLFWSDGIADGIAGPSSGGIVYSRNRTSGNDVYGYLIYKVVAPAGQVISDPVATITVHTQSFAYYDVIVESSLDGFFWENAILGHTNGWSETGVVMSDQTGDPRYQGLTTLYYRIAMPTFVSPMDYHAVLDDLTINGTLTGSIGQVTLNMIKSPSSDPNLVVTPTVGTYQFNQGDIVDINATGYTDCPDVWSFIAWSGGVTDPNSAVSTVVLNTTKTVTAMFISDRICGDGCHMFPGPDTNNDCRVNLTDFAQISEQWLVCSKPECD